MKYLYLLLASIPSYFTIHAQQKYILRGKIEMRSKSGNIHINRDLAPIKSDGTFEISGEVPASHLAFIYTDSSQAEAIWLDVGTFTVECRESTLPGYPSLLLRTTTLNGSRDAKLYSAFHQIVYSDNMEGKKALTIKFIDSIFQHFPDAGPLGNIITEVYHYIGDSATEKYIGMLPVEIQNKGDIKMLEGEMKRNAKIRTEKTFEDFSMKTPTGETFQLSSLKGKKIVLLDFWASECAPCRAAHPGMIELYKKYKGRGLEIVSISIDSKRDAWLSAMAKDGIDAWINVSDLKGFETDLIKDYFISYIPYHFLLDGDRKIINVYSGGASVQERQIEEVLNKKE